MNIFARRQNIQEIPSELQPYYHETRDRTRLFGFVGGALLLLLAVGLLVFFFNWRGRHDANTKHNTTSQSSTTQAAKPKTTAGSSSTSSSAATSQNSQSALTQGASSTQATVGATSQPAAIPNTGPGQTISLFAATTVAGVLVYQVHLRRKTASA